MVVISSQLISASPSHLQVLTFLDWDFPPLKHTQQNSVFCWAFLVMLRIMLRPTLSLQWNQLYVNYVATTGWLFPVWDPGTSDFRTSVTAITIGWHWLEKPMLMVFFGWGVADTCFSFLWLSPSSISISGIPPFNGECLLVFWLLRNWDSRMNIDKI